MAHEDGGSIQPSGRRASDPIKKGCSRSSSEEGNLAHTVLRQQAVPGVVLCSGQLGPCSPALSSNVHRRKRWTGRGVARKRRRDGAVVFVRCFAASLQRREARSEGLSRLVALAILLREGKSADPVKGSGESEGEFDVDCVMRHIEHTRIGGS